jgi:hypothetical protein
VVALSTSFTLTLKAEAGGIEQPTPEHTTSDKAFVSVVATSKLRIWGNWKIWSKPYLFNGNICRENAGNLICLTPKQANNNRWFITSNSGN